MQFVVVIAMGIPSTLFSTKLHFHIRKKKPNEVALFKSNSLLIPQKLRRKIHCPDIQQIKVYNSAVY